MFNFLKNLFQKKNASVIGIDIGSSAIKIVQIRKKGGRAVLETYGALALGPYAGVSVGKATNLPIEKLVVALGDIIKEAKVTTKKGGIAIPFSSSLMSVIEMPDVSVKQLATMVPLEARKYIPVPISEVSLDWSIIPKDQLKSEHIPEDAEKGKVQKLGKTEVLVVAIHNDTIAEYQDIVKKADLDANFFEIEIFSTMRSVVDQSPEPVMILDIGAASTKLYIVERGGIRVSHTINRGSQDITSSISASLGVSVEQAEIMKRSVGYENTPSTDGKDVVSLITLTLDFIFSEARRVMFNYQQKYQKNVSKVILVGGGAAMKGVSEVAKKNLQTEVVAGDPFAKVEAPAFLVDILRSNGPEFAVALGIALRRLQESE
ncbi:MAG: type IV pilus assembly protein PilM [Candidatus Paceibacterota bacterium]